MAATSAYQNGGISPMTRSAMWTIFWQLGWAQALGQQDRGQRLTVRAVQRVVGEHDVAVGKGDGRDQVPLGDLDERAPPPGSAGPVRGFPW